ncbi:hypothetical protein AC626_25075 [Pseudoalteromonas rubra]|uniref:Outer membrane protein beta-barrel domain-containing protein n=1 Tax=Pseudoalteromonas rubra TaxID=43658 RepID=A0A0L0EKZ8_9GAMM|nr:hypothetical protein AC626_25075 [Pseudoalteromonas rubra]
MNKHILGLLLATASLGAQASELSKSYLEVGYGETSLDGAPSSVDPQGFIIAGSYEFANGIFMGLKIDQHSDSLTFFDKLLDDDYDVDETTFNLGYICVQRAMDAWQLALRLVNSKYQLIGLTQQ